MPKSFKRPVGRPIKPASEEGKRYPLNMRTTKAIRDLMVEASLASGRSLSQEVEKRLEQSFRDDRIELLLQQILSKVDP